MYDNLLCVKQKRFENEGGCGKVGQVEGQNVHERGVGWPMLFLRAKRIPGDGVINKIFWKIFPPISNPATQVAPRKDVFVIIAFSSNYFVNKIK